MERKIITDYIAQHKERVLNELLDLLKIPSISADKKYSADVLKTAEAVKQRLIEAGADNVEISATDGYPVVYAEKIINREIFNKKPFVVKSVERELALAINPIHIGGTYWRLEISTVFRESLSNPFRVGDNQVVIWVV